MSPTNNAHAISYFLFFVGLESGLNAVQIQIGIPDYGGFERGMVTGETLTWECNICIYTCSQLKSYINNERLLVLINFKHT